MDNINKIRCFISFNFNKKIINNLKDIQRKIKNDNLFIGKITEPINLHLTLKFLGEIEEQKIKEVKKRLNEIKFNEIELTLGEIGVFSRNEIKIIWIKLNGAEGIQKAIDNKLKDLFPLEERFMSHITLFRVKKVYNKRNLFLHLNKVKFDKISFPASSFYLMQSILNKNGPVYSEIEKYNLERLY